MKGRALTVLCAALVVASGAFPVSAGQDGQADLGVSVSAPRAVATPTGMGLSSITGHTLTVNRTPFPFANVRLRNLDNGMVVSQTASNVEGEFSFLLSGGGVFVPEVTSRNSGEVLAVGDLLVLEAGEAAGVVVLLPENLVPYRVLFGASSAELIGAAATAGIVGLAPGEALSGEE